MGSDSPGPGLCHARFAPDTAEQAECWIDGHRERGTDPRAQVPRWFAARRLDRRGADDQGFAEHWLADKTKREARRSRQNIVAVALTLVVVAVILMVVLLWPLGRLPWP